jgi:metallo-beta-lactamase class B
MLPGQGTCSALALATLSLTLAGTTCATAQTQTPVDVAAQSITADLRIEPLGKGIYRHISYTTKPGYGRIEANGLLICAEHDCIMIDTPWNDALTAALFQWTQKTLGRPITTVIPTHAHDDNLGGLAEAHRRGACSYAYEKTVERAKATGVELPKVAIAEACFLQIGTRRLDLRFVGAGHTFDNIVVWLPDDGVLFGGCLVKAAEATNLGNISEADLHAWPRTIERLKQELGHATIIVPGHGAPGGPELLDHTAKLLRDYHAKPTPGLGAPGGRPNRRRNQQ